MARGLLDRIMAMLGVGPELRSPINWRRARERARHARRPPL